MHYVVTLKVYREVDGDLEKEWYRVKNGEEVIALDITSGDIMNIDGIGSLEVYGLQFQQSNRDNNPYKALTISCGVVAS